MPEVGWTEDCRPDVVSGWTGTGVSVESSRTSEVPLWITFESYVMPTCDGGASSRALAGGSMTCG
jgi:hypothetical protein